MEVESEYLELINKSAKIKRRYIASTWNFNEEHILQVWAEKASGWAWLHDKSQRYYRKQSDQLTYPSIILNTKDQQVMSL